MTSVLRSGTTQLACDTFAQLLNQYEQRDVRPGLWAFVKAVKDGTAPSPLIGTPTAQFPRVRFPEKSSYTYSRWTQV